MLATVVVAALLVLITPFVPPNRSSTDCNVFGDSCPQVWNSDGQTNVFDETTVGGPPAQDDGYTNDESDGDAEPEIPLGCDTAFALANPDKTCGLAAKDVPGEPAVTITDLAIFRPETPALTGDPVGYGLMNAPANIVATAAEQTVGGELFNRPVQVRFVPVQFTFDYGDGATRVSDTGGATWEALGVPQFTPTSTTHPYSERGTYTVSVTVAYAPSVDFGSGWRPVAGTVSATSGGYGIQIVESRTALVEHDCLEDPSGVGCPTG